MAQVSNRFPLVGCLIAGMALATGCTIEVNTDTDFDGVENEFDECPGTRRGDPVDAFGCSTADDDGDGVLNDRDSCSGTDAGDPVDTQGCSTRDDDGDGIGNQRDLCLTTAAGEPVDVVGCSTVDDDNDGVGNDRDMCPATEPGVTVDSTGCDAPDGDGDGVADVEDACPGTRRGDPVDADGCSTVDDDGDGIGNDEDECPGTAAGAPVDRTGCELVVGEGTLETTWLIDGRSANASTCAANGITDVRFVVLDGSASGPVFREWETPCANGGFDSRFDVTAPTVPLDQMFFSFFEAIDARGNVLDTSPTYELELFGSVVHAVLATSDFSVAFVDELTFPIRWETGFGSGFYGTCVQANVNTMVGYDLFPAGPGDAFFSDRGIACVNALIFSSDDNPEFGPGSYDLALDATASDGTKWGGTCGIEYAGGIATVPVPCDVPIIP